MTARRARALLGLAVMAIAVGAPAPSSAEGECAEPLVNTLISAEAAISRPAIVSPSEYALSMVYSQVEQATKPLFTYAEAGPQYAGAFEALLPVGTPPLRRAVSAYPSDDIPDDDTDDWGGESQTSVTPTSASAMSRGGRALGVGDATAENARSWVTSTVDCDVVTVIAGWSASNVVLAPGVTADQMGERVTLVVGPDGASSDIETTLVGVEGADTPGFEGRPADPVTDPMRENGGPRVEAGEPRTEAGTDGATASGGGFNFLLTDPSTGQGAVSRIGSVNATIEILGPLSPSAALSPATSAPVRSSPPSAAVVDAPVVAARPPMPATRAVAGTPPPPSPVALEYESVAVTDRLVSAIEVTTRSWFWPAFLTALALASTVTVGTGRLWRHRFPTLDWLFGKTDRGLLHFLAVYLRW